MILKLYRYLHPRLKNTKRLLTTEREIRGMLTWVTRVYVTLAGTWDSRIIKRNWQSTLVLLASFEDAQGKFRGVLGGYLLYTTGVLFHVR